MIKTITDNQITQDDIKKYHFIHHAITKDEVEKMDFKRIKETLNVFKESGKQGKNKLMITFSGYLDTPKEIYEIDDIRKYVANLINEFPYIFYFLTNADYTSTTFLLCLSNLKSLKKIDKNYLNINCSISSESINKIINGLLNYGAQIGENEINLYEIINNIINPKDFNLFNSLFALARDISYLKSL